MSEELPAKELATEELSVTTEIKAAPVETGRIVIVETIYHTPMNGQPTALELRLGRTLKTDEQVYQRNLKLESNWIQLDSGWLESCSLLVVQNKEPYLPSERNGNPANKIIEICLCANEFGPGQGRDLEQTWVVYPDEDIRARPRHLNHVYLRCLNGIARCSITLFPE